LQQTHLVSIFNKNYRSIRVSLKVKFVLLLALIIGLAVWPGVLGKKG
jgi:hypothetical protein